jgi:hypothetical protein
VCVCSLSYPACKAHAPCYIVFCGLSGCTMFSTLSHKERDFPKTTLVSSISHSKKYLSKYYHKWTEVFIKSTRYSCQIAIKIEFPRKCFVQYTNTTFTKNPCSGSRVVERGLTDGQTTMTTLTVTFCNFANDPKNWLQRYIFWFTFEGSSFRTPAHASPSNFLLSSWFSSARPAMPE